MSGCRRLMLAACLLVLSGARAEPTEPATDPLFAEPGSGRPVAGYEVTLPMRDGARDFRVPDDCAQVLRQYGSGDADRSRVIGRRLWLKAASDCRYNAFLHRHARKGLTDHLGELDFRALDLNTLPAAISCSGSPVELCSAGPGSETGDRPLFAPRSGGSELASVGDEVPCRLVNGRLLAGVYRDAAELRCERSQRASVRLLGVDRADINGDGIMDAILRLAVYMPGEGRRSIRLPLTRLSADGPLSIPQDTAAESR
jgi:hypothetical protein